MSQILIIIAIVAYLCLVVGIGVVFSKKNKNTDDFYLGGRKLGPFVTAMSAEASDMSSWLLMGLPGLAYLSGIAEPVWTALGLAVGTYVNWLLVAKRIRVFTHEYKSITLPNFFSKRFGGSRVITFFSAAFIIVFFIPYTASGFAACGKLFASLFGVDYVLAMIVSAIIIVLYCALGGFMAASTSDLIQSIVMTVALFVVIGFGISSAGGFDSVMNNAKGLAGYLDLFNSYNPADGSTSPYDGLTIVSTLAWGLGYMGMPHILLRFMAIEDENKLKLSRRIASVWVVISMAAAVFIGIVGFGMSKNGAIETLTKADSETIIIVISNLLSTYGPIFALVAGVILAGILAATMSTADSQLLAAASSISQNIVAESFGIKLSQKKNVLVARLTVVAIAVVAVFLALDPDSSVFRIISFAWAGFGATFGPVVILALFWRKANKNGAISGMITGAVAVFLWKYVIATLGGVFAIYELLPAFIIALVVNVVVSLVTGEPDKNVVEMFDKAKEKLG